jgi:ribosomal protein L35
MRKSLSKRIKITKNKKIVRRFMAIDHFRTRKTTKNVRRKNKTASLDYPIKKILNY